HGAGEARGHVAQVVGRPVAGKRYRGSLPGGSDTEFGRLIHRSCRLQCPGARLSSRTPMGDVTLTDVAHRPNVLRRRLFRRHHWRLSTQERVPMAKLGLFLVKAGAQHEPRPLAGSEERVAPGWRVSLTRQYEIAGKSGARYRYTPLEESRFLPPAGANFVIAKMTK